MSVLSSSSDRNLLFGILALQVNFITRDALIAGMNAWVLEKHRPLGEILVEQGALKAENRALLEPLVEQHVKEHDNDPQESLAAISSVESVRRALEQVGDAEVQASLGHVGNTPTGEGDPWRTEDHAPSLSSRHLRYKRLRPHARGGLGEVFVALDEELKREVALKEIQNQHADRSDSRARFLLEAEITGKLEHPGVVPVYGVGTYPDGRPFYAMRFVKGDSLKDAIERFYAPQAQGLQPLGFDSLAFRQLLGRFVDVCDAVAYAHDRGVLHRDLKPGNVMLGRYGETLVVDWGLAKLLGQRDEATTVYSLLTAASAGDSAPTQMGQAVGTPQYMSPEQAAGRLDLLGPASDVYSLGATLYCLLTGKPPFPAPGAEGVGALLREVEKGDFVPPRRVKLKVPRPLEAICLKAMASRPEGRYASVEALAGDVQQWLAGEPVSAWPEPLAVKAGRWVRKHRAPAAAMAAATVVALVLGSASGVWVQQRKERERQAHLLLQERAGEQARAGLEQATQLRKGYRFADAEAMLEQVRGWSTQAGDPELDAALEHARADLALARDLDTVRQKAATQAEGKWDPKRRSKEYPRVLAGHGLDVLEGDLDELGQKIHASAVREIIIASLDDWAQAERDPQRKQRLLALANLADQPAPWQQAVRDAIARKDGKRLRQLARQASEATSTPDAVLLLAGALGKRSDEATALLRRMQLAQPRDFWISFVLGSDLALQKRPREAAECFLVAVALRPDSAAAHYNLGTVSRIIGKVEEAIACHCKAIELDPEFAAAHTGLGNALGKKGKVEEAIACHRKAIALDPDDPGALTNLGVALHEKGKVDEAIACYRKAIALDSDYALAHTNLGAAWRDKGKVDEAIACCRKAIELDPEDAGAHNHLGLALEHEGKAEEAMACYRKAIQLEPRFALPHINLGVALYGKRKVDEAVACFRKAIELEPTNATAHNNLGKAWRDKGKVDQAIACCRKAIELDPRFAAAHHNLGLALQDRGKVDEAIACFRKAIDLNPRFARAHASLGVTLYATGKVDEAIACFRKAVELEPSHAVAHYNLGKVLKARGKVDEAIACYRRAVELDPENSMAHNNLGSALHATGKLDEAVACFRRAVELDSRDALAHNNLGTALKAQGKLDEAIACYRKAIELEPKHASAYAALGQALMRQGKFVESQEFLRRGLELLPPGQPLRELTASWARLCRQRLAADAKLTEYLTGKGAPADPAAQVQVADLAQQSYRRLYLASARLYRDAFARQPTLADAHRYDAACAAALAGTGQGKDAGEVDDRQRAYWRQQALDWLLVEFAVRSAQAKTAAGRTVVREQLGHWLKDPDLAAVRDEPSLAKLPEKEREAWRKSWADVAALLRKIEPNKEKK
jgi:tetratricopeptide (TPR) repeat protein/serine/threonine protein kinase